MLKGTYIITMASNYMPLTLRWALFKYFTCINSILRLVRQVCYAVCPSSLPVKTAEQGPNPRPVCPVPESVLLASVREQAHFTQTRVDGLPGTEPAAA